MFGLLWNLDVFICFIVLVFMLIFYAWLNVLLPVTRESEHCVHSCIATTLGCLFFFFFFKMLQFKLQLPFSHHYLSTPSHTITIRLASFCSLRLAFVLLVRLFSQISLPSFDACLFWPCRSERCARLWSGVLQVVQVCRHSTLLLTEGGGEGGSPLLFRPRSNAWTTVWGRSEWKTILLWFAPFVVQFCVFLTFPSAVQIQSLIFTKIVGFFGWWGERNKYLPM